MENSKRGFLPMPHGLAVNKTQCPSDINEIKKTSNISNASDIESNIYDMFCA